MTEGYDADAGGRCRGGVGGSTASGRATAVAAAPIANEVLVANLGKIADKRRVAPVVVAPPASSSGEGSDDGVFVFVIVESTDVARRHTPATPFVAVVSSLRRAQDDATTSSKRPQVRRCRRRPCERSCCL